MRTGGSRTLVAWAALALPGIAHAQSAAGETGPDESHLPKIVEPAEKRSGLVIGLQTGIGASYTTGYPDDVNRIGDPKYYAASGAIFSSMSGIFIEGAIADTVNVGFWFGGSQAKSNDWTASAGGGGLRIDAFPFWSLGRGFRDLSTFAELGFGATRLQARHGDSPGASGAESYVGLGAFYEFTMVKRFLGGHMVAGPFLEGQLVTSRAATSRGAFLGARFAFYGGP